MFKYNLESVLTLRENIEDVKKKELGLANKKYEEEIIIKNKLLNLETNTHTQIRETNSNNGCLDINYMRTANNYMSLLKTKIKDQEEIVAKAANDVDKKRDELVVSVKDRKIIENLKAIKYDEYRVEEARAEQSVIDEIITYKYRPNEEEI